MKKNILVLGFFLVFVVSALFLYPIGKLVFTDAKVTKSMFVEEYYIKVPVGASEFNILKDYLESKGWSFNKEMQMGGLYQFERQGEKIEITNKNIKTIIKNGKLNY
jgi:hypothetical protein